MATSFSPGSVSVSALSSGSGPAFALPSAPAAPAAPVMRSGAGSGVRLAANSAPVQARVSATPEAAPDLAGSRPLVRAPIAIPNGVQAPAPVAQPIPAPASRPLSLTRSFDLRVFDHVFQELIAKGGPVPAEYAAVSRSIRQLGEAVRSGVVQPAAVQEYMHTLTRRFFQGTMQAEALAKQFGYSGDFQIIDHIYTQEINPAPHLRAWDFYFHAQAAPHAVRNRKAYFQRLMQAHMAVNTRPEPLFVLNVASGPGRDLCEFFQNHPDADVTVDCVDVDARAITYGESLCGNWSDRIRFHHRNVLRHVPGRAYDLIWSAGLFDYLNDRIFVHLVKALIAAVRPGGELVIGNFSDYNPSRDYMELMGNWHLQHRDKETLIRLATQAGAEPADVQVLWEPEGVNYFLHIQR